MYDKVEFFCVYTHLGHPVIQADIVLTGFWCDISALGFDVGSIDVSSLLILGN